MKLTEHKVAKNIGTLDSKVKLFLNHLVLERFFLQFTCFYLNCRKNAWKKTAKNPPET